MLKPTIEQLTRNMCLAEGVYYAQRGDVDAPERLFLVATTHGMEIASVIALAKLLEQDWRWPKVKMTAVFQDPEGYAEEGYGFLALDGTESVWPPLFRGYTNKERYWAYVDENSAFGNTVDILPRHKFIRQLMDQLKPTFCLSLHETVQSETQRNLFWAGAGLLIIEAFPMAPGELAMAMGYEAPLANPLRWAAQRLYDWIRPLMGLMRYEFVADKLQENDGYQLLTRIAKRYEELGGELCGDAWMRYQEVFGRAVIGKGRMAHEEPMIESEWLTVTDYALRHYGAIGCTTESFPCGELGLRGIDKRVARQMQYIQAVLGTLNERHD